MKLHLKTSTPPTSIPLLCRGQWENEIFYIVAFYTGTEYISPETKKPVKGTVTGWEILNK